MAELLPLRALRYDLDRVPSLGAVIAPPYDVSDPVLRARLLERTPLNILAADLPDAPSEDLDVRYRRSAELLAAWQDDGVLIRDGGPGFWALEQRFVLDDGTTSVRRGLFARVRVTGYGAGLIRPHERTHPAAVQDRLALTRATRTNLSPVFALYDDADDAVRLRLEPVFRDHEPAATATQDDGTKVRLWRIGDPASIAELQRAFVTKELLIADGHHRYEASRLYADEQGPEGEHRYALMLLVAVQDGGLRVQPTHRLVSGLDEVRRTALSSTLREHFVCTPVAPGALCPPPGRGPLELGFIDAADQQAYRCVLRTQAIADAAMPGVPDVIRVLDTAVLEALVLRGPLALNDEALRRQEHLRYARTDDEALALVQGGQADCAFFLRATPLTQVQAVAAAGLTMPPKSTSFQPKVPTGLLMSPLA